MKQVKNNIKSSVKKALKASQGDVCVTSIHLTVVSEKEREQYRVPSYGYIL